MDRKLADEDTAMTEPYNASSITILSGLEPVRMRPGMFIGGTGRDGLHRLVHEVVENAVDEALVGACTRIQLTLHADGSCSVEDDGRGIPVDPHPANGRPAAEVVMTTLHAGGKFKVGSYAFSGGLHGVGLSCVNALSSWLKLDVWRDGHHHVQSYTRGAPDGDLVQNGVTTQRGTRVHFCPDPTVFPDAGELSYFAIAVRLAELAFLTPGLEIRAQDERSGREEVFRFDGGLASFVESLNEQRTPIHPGVVVIEGESDGVHVQAALQWTTLYADDTRSFVNTIRTVDGGTHVAGLQSALMEVIAARAEATGQVDAGGGERLRDTDVREGLTCVLATKIAHPEFVGQTKGSLGTPVAKAAVATVVAGQLEAFLQANPAAADAIVGKAIDAMKARRASTKSRERARHKMVSLDPSPEAYKLQFGVRSRNWHQSANWLADAELLAAHADMCQVDKNARLLDVCCGSGVVGASFRGKVAHLTGLDITPEMKALAEERLDEVVLGTVFDMPFDDGSFDIVSNREVLHLFPRPEEMLSEVHGCSSRAGSSSLARSCLMASTTRAGCTGSSERSSPYSTTCSMCTISSRSSRTRDFRTSRPPSTSCGRASMCGSTPWRPPGTIAKRSATSTTTPRPMFWICTPSRCSPMAASATSGAG